MILRFVVEHHAVLDSTNKVLRARALGGAPAGLVLRADQQTAGIGRRSRVWESPPGNLYCSLLLRPTCPPGDAAILGFAAAMAVGQAIRNILPGGSVRHKWPNDVLIDKAKVAGLLLEAACAANGLIDWLVIGIGVNIYAYPENVPYPATSLAAQGAQLMPPERFLYCVLEQFELLYEKWVAEGATSVMHAWRAHAEGVGEDVVVRLDRETLHGRLLSVDDSGILRLRAADGQERLIAAGDLFFPDLMR